MQLLLASEMSRVMYFSTNTNKMKLKAIHNFYALYCVSVEQNL